MIFMYFEAELGVGTEEWKITTSAVSRIIWMAWIFFTMVVMLAYSTFLISSLTIPTMEALPETLEEFLDSPRHYKMVRVDWGDSVDDYLRRSKHVPLYKRLWDRLVLAGPYELWWDFKLMGPFGGQWFGQIEPYSDAWIAVMNNDPREFVVSKARLVCVPVAYAAPVNGILADSIDPLLRRLSRSGILGHLRRVSRETMYNRSAVDRAAYKERAQKPDEVALVLSIDNIASVFFCWCVGTALGFVAFVVEICCPTAMGCIYDRRRVRFGRS